LAPRKPEKRRSINLQECVPQPGESSRDRAIRRVTRRGRLVAAQVESAGSSLSSHPKAVMCTGRGWLRIRHPADRSGLSDQGRGAYRSLLEAHKPQLFLEFLPRPSAVWEYRGRVGGLDRIEAWHCGAGVGYTSVSLPLPSCRSNGSSPTAFIPVFAAGVHPVHS